MASSPATCAGCQLPQDQLSNPLRPCSKCLDVQYCSRECQKDDWMTHKEPCDDSFKARFNINRPFMAIRNGTWLTNRRRADVYQLLCDVFRMRQYDIDYFECVAAKGSVYHPNGTKETELKNFGRFLETATGIDRSEPNNEQVLPTWWAEENIVNCLEVAENDKVGKVGMKTNRRELEEFYGDTHMTVQLRLFGKALDGFESPGQRAMPGALDPLVSFAFREAAEAMH